MSFTTAVIGGTGFSEFVGMTSDRWEQVRTPYGPATLARGQVADVDMVFLPRHGRPAQLPPHAINYRANIRALYNLGVSRIIAVNAVGSVTPDIPVPALVIPDQIIDYTWGRHHTFHGRDIRHIDFTEPFDPQLRERLCDITKQMGSPHRLVGVYGCTQGPRLESAAEIQRMGRDGCDIVGMTAMPETALARELEIPYASICVNINPGAGLAGSDHMDFDSMSAALETGMDSVRKILERFLTLE
ncbi:MAG: 5'-methylthioadenosine phosphorylase [OM182 bacterium MED-G24]|uniref:Purine nucleoside phosphorylase n=1 Tax=OM182 bacterium MED-G24 TaxID=1986255 RepID=A0A2A5WM96_9GAMM|nr:MAG: 5'-methylthioadenosine phosphorylase [OM182 bacterium MED-G24]|tara:strand:- start:11494 stop:12225 length:732 start_codon:yes stop_codon:yes gene_type:complete